MQANDACDVNPERNKTMRSFTIAQIEKSLIAAAGKIALGIATPATLHCIEIAVAEIARRESDNVGRDHCDQHNLRSVKPIAAKVAAMAMAAA